MSKPNILFLISDEQSPRTVGCYGADFMRTPNLDRLASQGTLFENAYCAFPLCVPGRNSLMSGQQCHKIKAYDIGSPLASDLPTWAHMLARAGYRTPLHGKMHFLGADQLHGFEEHLHEKEHGIDGFRWGEETGDGTAYECVTKIHFTDTLKSVGRRDYNLTWDTASRDSAIAFLDARKGDPEPFCLTVSFNFPHYPLVVDRDVYESYADANIPPPVTGGWRHPRNDHLADNVWGFNKMTEQQTRASRQAYCAMGTMLDAWIGEVLAALGRSGHADNTIIIYTTDHGEMWGEHGMWCKNCFYEDSARVPLIISAPGLGVGQRVAAPVSHLDLYPTLRDIVAAADWKVPLDGRSLWPLVTGQAAPDADRPVFCEYHACDVRGPERMVRWHQYKLNYYHNWGMELFDIECDPNELVNRIDDPACREVVARLLQMLMDGWDPIAIDADIRIEQNRRTLIGESMRRQKAGGFSSGV